MSARIPFVIVGENVHATRSVKRGGVHVVGEDGDEHVVFTGVNGMELHMPIAAPVRASSAFQQGKVKHVRNALLLGLGGDEVVPENLTGEVSAVAAEIGRAYLVAVAAKQQSNGAHYIDVNVDELDGDPAVQAAAMEWLVELLEPELTVPLALDSSSVAVLQAGLEASSHPSGPLLLNSASVERLDVLDLAAESRSPVIVSAAGVGELPGDAAGRATNAMAIVGAAEARGIPRSDLHVDPLVIPVGVDSGSGAAFLDAVRTIRTELGSEIRITGGLSNISFGLPQRSLLNEVFVALAVTAGVDSGIINPNSLEVERAVTRDRESAVFELAANVLNGVDTFAMDYLTAFREGRLTQ